MPLAALSRCLRPGDHSAALNRSAAPRHAACRCQRRSAPQDGGSCARRALSSATPTSVHHDPGRVAECCAASGADRAFPATGRAACRETSLLRHD
jgi:hypothetical protein